MVTNLNSIECFFFDLDGTLLNISDQDFELMYSKLIANSFKDLYNPETFFSYFLPSVEALMNHRDYSTNVIESFLSKFSELSGMGKDEIWERLHNFYTNDFGKLQNLVKPSTISKDLIDKIQSQNKKVVLATNPVFPEIATKQRVEWAGLDYNSDFLFVPHVSNSTAVKPDPQYYHNLIDIVKIEPSKILMVGNDYLYDGSASQVGIKTWIVDFNQSHLDYKDKFQIDYEGSLEELLVRIN
ncbi:MAG: HAD family hydrolase [Candidatus Heimdallarchaeota archaeon]|nr:HAD family hydrolase [Candidatus Heimdallarchaeota archaeon]